MTISRFFSRTVVLGTLALAACAPAAHAQYFDYSVVFKTGAGVITNTVTSTDGLSTLTITNSSNNGGLFSGATGTNTNLISFLANSTSTSTSSSVGVFNSTYQLAVTFQPSDSNGVVIAGTTPQTQTLTGTFSGNLTQQLNNLSNTYDNIVSTPGAAPVGGPAEVLNFSFSDGSVSQVRALVADFSPGSPPGGLGSTGQLGSRVLGNIALAGTPEPGTWAMLFGMGVTGATLARRRQRRK